MARFNLDDYVQVNERIAQFWTKHPNGAIEVDELHVDDHTVRYKARVYAERTDEKPIGTGHAEEVRISEAEIKRNPKLANNPNAGSAVENCETSAVGRALAMAGFGVSKSVASRQEMEKVQRMQDRRENETSAQKLDKADEPATVPSNGASEHLSQDEARVLAGKIKATGMEMTAVKLKLTAMGIETPKTLAGAIQEMTKDQALELYSWVQGEQEEK